MKRLKDEWREFGRWAPVGCYLLMVGLTLGLAVPRIFGAPKKQPPLTTFEQKVATRAALALGDAPHIQLIGTGATCTEWLAKPANLRRVKAGGIGTWVIWKSSYTTGDATVGAPLDKDMHLHYSDPAAAHTCIDYIHDIGGRAVMYVAPRVWRDQWRGWGLNADRSVDEILSFVEEYGLDGVYLDGAEFGWNEWQTMRAFQRLRQGHGLYVICHFSIQPNITNGGLVYGPGQHKGGRVEYLMPFADFVDMGLWGETNTKNLSTEEEALATLKRVAHIDTHPAMLMIYKAAKDTVYYADPERRMPTVARLFYVEHVGVGNFAEWETHGLPTWLALKAEYEADPDAFVRRAAREW